MNRSPLIEVYKLVDTTPAVLFNAAVSVAPAEREDVYKCGRTELERDQFDVDIELPDQRRFTVTFSSNSLGPTTPPHLILTTTYM